MNHASHALQRTALILTLVLGCHVLAATPVAGVAMGARFAQWWLNTAKVDVALFAIKGLDATGIATRRGSAQETIRAQRTRQTDPIAPLVIDLIEAASIQGKGGPHG